MTAKTLAAAAIADLALAACGTSSKPTGTTGAGAGTPAVVWAGCLRSHGVPDFPTRSPGHTAQFPDNAKQSLSTHSRAVLAAEHARKTQNPLSGGGLRPGSSQNAALLEFARCVRANGVPDYPDPTYGKNGRPNISDLSVQGIDTQSPAFINAAQEGNGHGIPLG